MKKNLISLFILLLVFISFFYTLCAFISGYYLSKALNPLEKDDSKKILFFSNASRWNPLDWVPWYKRARLLRDQGISSGNMSVIREALQCSLKVKELNACDFDNALLMIDLHRLLGSSGIVQFRELKELNRDFPNNVMAGKILVEQGVDLWAQLTQTDKDFVADLFQKLLSKMFWGYNDLLEKFAVQIQDMELLKRIIPEKREALIHIRSLMSQYQFRFDYVWLEKKLESLEKACAVPADAKPQTKKKSLSEVKSEWLARFGAAKELLTNEQLIGWFHDGKEIPKGSLWSNGTVYGLVSLKSGEQKLIINAKSTLVKGIPAYMLLRINGEILSGSYVDSIDFKEYSFPIKIEKDQEALVSVSLLNDANNKETKEDRNLNVGGMGVK